MRNVAAAFLCLAGLAPTLARGATPTPSADWWIALALRDLHGRAVPTPTRWCVVMFLDPECPVANGYLPVINALAAEFSPRGMEFLGAYVDPALALESLRRHASDFDLRFLAVDDRRQALARGAGATYSSETVVFGADGAVLYRGRIDDRVGANGVARPAAAHHELREVLLRLCAGERGPFAASPGFGCALPVPVGQP